MRAWKDLRLHTRHGDALLALVLAATLGVTRFARLGHREEKDLRQPLSGMDARYKSRFGLAS